MISAQYAPTNQYAHEVNQYVRDELNGQYAMLAGAHRSDTAPRTARRGRKGRPVWAWTVHALTAILPWRSG